MPGRVNAWAGKFARYVAVAFPEAANYFPKDKVAVTGNPVRDELIETVSSGAREFLELEQGVPVIYITGGSQGAMNVNDVIVDILPQLLEKYAVIHQTGKANVEDIRGRSKLLLDKSTQRPLQTVRLSRYLCPAHGRQCR